MKEQHETARRRTGRWMGLLLGLSLGAVGLAESRAAGLLVADGGFGGILEIKEQDVQVTINNGIAVTQVTQVFLNTENRQVEALYTFPVPRGASVANFSMWIQGKEMVGEVLKKQRAREIYNSYKQKRRDPGLLEQVDYRTFEMRIFPIAANAEQKVEITYYQELEYSDDWATYVYPLATATRSDIDARTTGRFSIGCEIKSPIPIVALESPSHPQEFVITSHTDGAWQADLEVTGGSLHRDVVLAHHLSRPKTGMDLLTSRQTKEDGFFCLTLTAGEDVGVDDEGMDYVFVLDVSGSMADQGKLLISKDSVTAFIDELGDQDRLEVMTFNSQPILAFESLQPATAAQRSAAHAFLNSAAAKGGTILRPALQTAYKYASADRPLNVVVLSDGLTEQRERQTLLELIQQRPGNTRVFCIGIGNDVNRPLLEQLADDAGGLAAFVSRGDNLKRQAELFRRKLMRPVATAVQISFDGIEVRDLEPKVMPNLYWGSPIRLYGRYQGAGSGQVRLRASLNGVEINETATLQFPEIDRSNPEIDRLWATHRIDQLLKQADRAGNRAAVTDEVIRLGEDFSVVTEYTSFIVLENDAEYRRWKIDRRNLKRLENDRAALRERRERFDAIREKAMADLGPQAVETIATPATQLAANRVNQGVAPSPQSRSTSKSSKNQSWDIGTGPVGPLGVGLTLWMLRRRRRQTASSLSETK